MSGKVEKKIYYRIEFETASAMSVGNGENQYSDKDVLRDLAGLPFVPGSSLAGIYRSFFHADDDREEKKYFGDIDKNDEEKEAAKKEEKSAVQKTESRVIVYDAVLKDNKDQYRTSIRDSVGLDEWKTARKGCKFDFETVEPGAVFVTYIEQNYQSGDRDICAEIADIWMKRKIMIGSKTMRGFGTVNHVTVYRREFELTTKDGKSDWLDFDMYEESCWRESDLFTESKGTVWVTGKISIDLQLCQNSGISIRRYTTKTDEKEETTPDFEQMTYYQKQGDREKEVPFIPGTTWAGAFRHHMESLIPGSVGEYFGISEKSEDGKSDIKKKSSVYFSDSRIEHAESKILTRNTVDRFTGGVIRGALLTEKMWYGGETKLHIEFPKNADDQFVSALAAALVDLHMGILSIGGMTSVGRGIFTIKELRVNNEKSVPVSRDMYEQVMEALKGENNV